MKTVQTKKSIMFLLLLIAFWGMLAWPWLSGQVTIPYDGKIFHLPVTAIVMDEISKGIFPSWNPFLAGGSPLLSDPQTLIYSPLYMILMGTGDYYSNHWFDIIQFLHVLFAGIGIFLFCRAQNLPAPAGVAAALVFMFGGVMASRMQHLAIIAAFCYTPWALLSLHLLLNQRRLIWIGVTAICVFLATVHFVQVSFLFCLLVVFYVLMDIASTEGVRARLEKLKYGLAAGAVSLLVIAGPALLVLQHIALSTRTHISFETVSSAFVIHPTTLLTLIAPNALGSLSHGHYKGIGDATEQYLYFGVFTAALVFCALLFALRKLHGKILFWAFVALLSLLYAMGKWTPIFKLFYDFIPGVALYRRPTDATFILVFSVAMILAYFLGPLTAYSELLKNKAFYRVAVVLPMLIIIPLILFVQCNSTGAKYFDCITYCYFILFLALVISLPVMAHHYPKFIASTMFSVIVLFAVAGDILLHNINIPMNAANWPGYALLERGKEGEIPVVEWLSSTIETNINELTPVRIESELPQNWSNPLGAMGFEAINSYNPLQLERYHNIVGIHDSGVGRRQTPLLPNRHAPIFNLLGVRYILAISGSMELDEQAFPAVHRSMIDGLAIEVRENPRAFPRVFSVTELIYEPDTDKIIKEGLHYQVDFSQQAVVEQASIDGIPLATRTPTRICEEPAVGSDKIMTYLPNRLVIESVSSCHRMLLLNNVWHQGWQATVNQEKRPLLRTNFLFQGVFLQPGRSLVELKFEALRFLNAGNVLRR